jgi:tetratricopeptide (TPR) repeat protein
MPEMPPNAPTHDATSDMAIRTHPRPEATTNAAGAMPSAPPGYELRDEIGRGGMGVVYRARDLALAREVAVKLLLDCYQPDSAVAQRFLEEAQITGQLQHPGIPAVHQTGTTPDGQPFLAMKLVKGRTLADLLGDRADPSVDRSRFLAIFEHVCHAVGYAHAHDVIHRDLKPSNIMVGAFDEVQVMDWGLAKVVTKQPVPGQSTSADANVEQTRTEIGKRRSAEMATQAGSLLGTPAFMSPEQAGGEMDRVGPRSDVFGLGAILCVILTGHPPYRGPDSDTVRLQAIRGQLGDAFARLDACGAEPELVAVAKRCLGELMERPADAAEVANAVARLRAAAEERARWAELERAEAEVRVAEQRKRRRVWYALATALLVGTAAALVFAVLARQAEGRAVVERDLKEEAREEAVANEKRARTAEAARRLELGRTAAAAAQLAAGRGQWQEALRLFETALEFGGGDEVELKLGRYSCRLALGQVRPALAELDELAARPDLGRFTGPVLLLKAENALWRQGGGDPRDLARAAIEKGLSPADAAYARVFLVQSAPEAIKLLQEATRLDPFHSRGLDCLAMLLFVTGRRSEFREVVTQMRLSRPDSATDLIYEVLLRAMDGDRTGAERAVSRLGKTGYAELVPLYRAWSDVLVLAQGEEFFFGGVPPQQFGNFFTEYARMAQGFSRMAGEKNANDATVSNMRVFQIPMFQALAETPQIKGLTTSGPLGAAAMLGQPLKMAEVFGAVAQTIPDGTFHLFHGLFLHQAGRLPEAESAFRRALESPSWANHRSASRFHLVRAQWQLANSPQTVPKERPLWKDRALANVRALTFSASKPLPPEPTSVLVSVASGCGDHALGLALTEAALRKKPNDIALLGWKLNLEIELSALARAETTATAVAAVTEARTEQRRAGWDAVVSLARAYHGAGRRADALRWCAWLRERLTRAGGDDPDFLDSSNGLGVLYWRMKELDKSIPIFERIWAARRKTRGERHPETLHAQINLGVNYRDAGRLKDAIRLLEQVEREGRGSPSLRWARGELLSTYVAAGKSTEGVRLTKEILAEARKEHAADGAALAGALAQCGHALLQLKAWGEAELVLREALSIREKAQPEVWTTFYARSMLGEALAEQKKYSEAERLLVQGFEGLKQRATQIPEPLRAVRLTEAADPLVRLCEALQKKDEAAKWRKEREAVRKP